MLTRKSSIVIATCGGFASGPTGGKRSSTSLKQRDGTHLRCRACKSHKSYATFASNDDGREENRRQRENHVWWPTPPKGQLHPTPYQIFSMNVNGTYTKTRFYELVKVYHPDKTHATVDSIPHTVKIERYRLIVAAHTILSDPAKRHAYDSFGAGWNGKAELGRRDAYYQNSPEGQPGPFTSGWGRSNDPIWRNATWEDWERFYARRAREAGGATATGHHRDGQSPQYLQNSYFVVLVMILALVGSSANYTRAKDAGTYFVAQRDIVHDQTAKDLRRVRQEASAGGRDERIEWFLRNREAALGLSDIDTVRDEKANRLLPDREVCQSDGVSGKDG